MFPDVTGVDVTDFYCEVGIWTLKDTNVVIVLSTWCWLRLFRLCFGHSWKSVCLSLKLDVYILLKHLDLDVLELMYQTVMLWYFNMLWYRSQNDYLYTVIIFVSVVTLIALFKKMCKQVRLQQREYFWEYRSFWCEIPGTFLPVPVVWLLSKCSFHPVKLWVDPTQRSVSRNSRAEKVLQVDPRLIRVGYLGFRAFSGLSRVSLKRKKKCFYRQIVLIPVSETLYLTFYFIIETCTWMFGLCCASIYSRPWSPK